MRLRPVLGLVVHAIVAPLAAQTASLTGAVRLPDARPTGAVIYLVPLDSGPRPALIDSLVIDQRDLRFVPPVLAVQPGATVQFQNSDAILHNVFSPPGPGRGFNLGTYPRPEARSRRFDEPGAHVILCHVHPEMLAYVVVVPSPYHAVADDEGHFNLVDLPPGRYMIRIHHRHAPRFERMIALGPGDRPVLDLDLAARRGNGRLP